MSFKEEHWVDAQGNPAGGVSSGTGFTISWQHGPLGRGAGRREPNGAFVEDVVAAVIGRLHFYQSGKFKSDFNDRALGHLHAAMLAFQERTADREKREVEGTHAR